MSIKVTKVAQDRVCELMRVQNFDPAAFYLRMGVKGGGCSGLSYGLAFDSELPDKSDKVFEVEKAETEEGGKEYFTVFERHADMIEGVVDMPFRVVVDQKSYLYLNGATIDYVMQGLTGGFIINNPNAKSTCGCGQSFH